MNTNLFNIFNPDWWLNENNNALQMTDAILFLLLLIPVIYLLIYGLASLSKYKDPYPQAEERHKFLILFTVLRNGQEAINSINHFLNTQMYPEELYDIAVVATQVNEEDLMTLLQMPINIVIPDKEDCTKVYAIQQVIQRYSASEYDAIVILNSDNEVVPNMLELLNNAYYSGCDSIQSHRLVKDLSTSTAILNAASDEINNRIFRKAHTTLGFSSALDGSGMMFDFEMAHRVIPRLKGDDFARAMELELLKENIFTEYLDDTICFCNPKNDSKQDLRIYQSGRILKALLHFPYAFFHGQWDLCEKYIQWIIPPRFLLSLYIITIATTISILYWPLCIKWWVLFIALNSSFLLALPEGEINKRLVGAIWSLPGYTFKRILAALKSLIDKVRPIKSDNSTKY